MFTLIRNYKTICISGMMNQLQGEGFSYSNLPEDTSSKLPSSLTQLSFGVIEAGKDGAPEVEAVLSDHIEAIKGVTLEDLRNFDAVSKHINGGKNIEKGSPKDVVTDIQEMLVFAKYDISYAGHVNGVDGDFGSTMTRVTKDFQLDNGLSQTGVIDTDTYNALLKSVNLIGGVSAQEATTGESISTVKIEAALTDYTEKKISEMSDFEKKALQRDINTLREKKGEKAILVDGIVGNGTKSAMTDLGYTEDTLVLLRNESQKIRNEKSLEISSQGIEAYPVEKAEIGRTIGNFVTDLSDSAINILIKKIAKLTSIQDTTGDGNSNWTTEQKTRRLTVAQYITDNLATMVDAGKISAMRASQVIEGLLAQEKFPSKPGKEAIAKMLGTISQLKSMTRDEIGQEIAANLDEKAALQAILGSKETMDMGATLESGEFNVGGKKVDIDRVKDMFIVTGNGNQRVGIRDTGAFTLTNIAIVGNVLVGLMGNGCEGNVIYIPLDMKPQVPKKSVPKKRTQTQVSKTLEKPEGPIRIIKNRWCDIRTNTWWIQWGYEGIPGGQSVDTGEPCNNGGEGGGGEGKGVVGTTPGVGGYNSKVGTSESSF